MRSCPSHGTEVLGAGRTWWINLPENLLHACYKTTGLFLRWQDIVSQHLEGSVRTQVFKNSFKGYIFSARGRMQTISFCWMNKYKIRHESSDHPPIMRIFLSVAEAKSTTTVCYSLILCHLISLPWKKRRDGEGGPQVLLSPGSNHAEPTPLHFPHRALTWWPLPTAGHRGGWGHETQDKRSVTIRKAWPRAAGEKLSLHIWVTRVWMLPCYLTFTTQFCDDRHL